MDNIEFLVQGSADEPYKVRFIKQGDNLSAYCTCPAGQNGMYCKHRFRILEGSTKGIVSSNPAEAATVQSWLQGTDVEGAMCKVKQIESEAAEVKKRLSAAKKALARSMYD